MSEYPPGLGPAVEYLPDHRAVHVDRLAALEALEREAEDLARDMEYEWREFRAALAVSVATR